MATMTAPQTMISIHGTEFAPGRLVIENHGGLLSWHGTVHGRHKPGWTVRLVAVVGECVYAGEALIKSLTMPETADDGPPANEFFGSGRLGRRTLTEVAEWLLRAGETER